MHLLFSVGVFLCVFVLYSRRAHYRNLARQRLTQLITVEQVKNLGLIAQLRGANTKIEMLTKLCTALQEKVASEERRMGMELNSSVLCDTIMREARAKAALRGVLQNAGTSEKAIDALMEVIDSGEKGLEN